MSDARDLELANEKLREPCRKALASLREHWMGLTLLIDDARIPLDNNDSKRMIRGPAVGRKNYYGSGSQWSGRLARMLRSRIHPVSECLPHDLCFGGGDVPMEG